MSKKIFHQKLTSASTRPTYPTCEEFDRNQKSFLSTLKSALLGAGALGALLVGCGDRALDSSETHLGGKPAQMDARIDNPPSDASVVKDLQPLGGVPELREARIDQPQDGGISDSTPLGGIALQRDARIDTLKDGG